MPDIKCSEFAARGWRHPAARIAIWSATLTPAPAGEWKTVFNHVLIPETMLGRGSHDGAEAHAEDCRQLSHGPITTAQASDDFDYFFGEPSRSEDHGLQDR